MTVKKRTSTAIFILIDIMIVAVSTIMPFVFRFGVFTYKIYPWFWDLAMKWMPLDMLIFVLVNMALHLYNRVWTYASVGEMIDCIKSAAITEAIYIIYRLILGIYMFRSYYPFNFMMLLMLLCGSRVSIRLIRGFEKRKYKTGDKRNIMIIGGGAAATQLIREYQLNTINTNIVCIIDDNPEKKGKRLNNVPIIGNREHIVEAAEKYSIDDIVIAIPSASPQE